MQANTKSHGNEGHTLILDHELDENHNLSGTTNSHSVRGTRYTVSVNVELGTVSCDCGDFCYRHARYEPTVFDGPRCKHLREWKTRLAGEYLSHRLQTILDDRKVAREIEREERHQHHRRTRREVA